MFMLPTRLLPPQFLLPAWNSRQLAQAVQRTHKRELHSRRDRKLSQEQDQVESHDEKRKRPSSRERLQVLKAEPGPKPAWTGSNEQSDGGHTTNRIHESNDTAQDRRSYDPVLRRPLEVRRVYGGSDPRMAGTVAEEHFLAEDTMETHFRDQKPDPSFEGLSLFEELFPEEAMARQKKEKLAMERFEKLPAFNWEMDTKQLEAHDRRQQEARQRVREKYQTIPFSTGDNRKDTGRKILPARQTPQSSQRTGQGQTSQDQPHMNKSRVSVLVLSACSKRLEETDFYRVGPKGNHIENWTSGILKVIPARDNVTLEPLGQYYLLFSSLAAARLYLDKTQRLLYLTKSSDFFSRNTAKRDARLREGEDLEAVLRNFTMVPAGGTLSLRLLEPPYSRGIQWMIDAAGPASLVARQNKSQHIVLFSTDRGSIKQGDLENAIMDDGKRRNLHWELAGTTNEAVVKLETRAPSTREHTEFDAKNGRRSTYQGVERYTLSFKDSNEARRFAREWHRRPFPSNRVPRPEDDAPPTVSAEVLW